MKLKKEWYCLNCRKFVEVNPIGIAPFGVTAQTTCRECGMPFVIQLNETSPDEFEKLVRKFKEQTGEV